VLQQNFPYLVTFDLDREHIVDADRPGEHCVQVWWGSDHLARRRSNFDRPKTQKDGQTDRRRMMV